MKFKRVSLFYYSPTHTTRKIISEIAVGIGIDPLKVIENNLTYPGYDEALIDVEPDDLVVIGAPVYAGRIATTALARLAQIRFAGNPVVLVAVYGNRNYDDALVELREMAINAGMRPVAAAAFIGEHSYSCRDFRIAKGRPDAEDKQTARDFGHQVYEKVQSLSIKTALPQLMIPGTFPLPERRVIPPAHAETRQEICVKCGKCETVCPTGAVYFKKGYQTHPELCTICFACVRACPHNARILNSEHVNKFREILVNTCSERRNPEFFFCS